MSAPEARATLLFHPLHEGMRRGISRLLNIARVGLCLDRKLGGGYAAYFKTDERRKRVERVRKT
jgi:hypothetical protein